MSPSLYGSTRLILPSTNQDLRMFNNSKVKKVKRMLFGPVDPIATQKFLEQEMKKIITAKSEKWNINLETGSTLTADGLYTWRPATPQKERVPLRRIDDSETDISDQYCPMETDNVRRQQPSDKCENNNVHHHHHHHHHKIQSRITDYMKVSKRPLSPCDVSKKQPSSGYRNNDIPASKIPRLDMAS
ncbi:uncharacterized protein LOC126738135 [Anthonomus grandis grandis]|uniref:uncharacterized protein LOC126738135 n=1 Tax=Anthonomus grandis grandis TaxID=2921223 RepID=UPI0021659FC2|nr:uncharacterized protein LOC126738135 [Anthonomus grandis grandis]XP_050299262.1 uncharacterized protein LOC126738135 [Anthonomus grandis grandis]XP_050299263.1 uncharacterized protein LOC126738135 [Anthonomus grandis grandis]XP_050299264.1 uncharacterized protein LOC126738135 [Anthonomus grandis grandis]XP_050299265.1 uncharacterized protein LOC126738135 [Anthonomus grandis grandis]